MRCLECTHMDMHAHRDHAKTGFGLCQFLPAGSFVSFSHPGCNKGVLAAPEEIEKRKVFEVWVEGRFNELKKGGM